MRGGTGRSCAGRRTSSARVCGDAAGGPPAHPHAPTGLDWPTAARGGPPVTEQPAGRSHPALRLNGACLRAPLPSPNTIQAAAHLFKACECTSPCRPRPPAATSTLGEGAHHAGTMCESAGGRGLQGLEARAALMGQLCKRCVCARPWPPAGRFSMCKRRWGLGRSLQAGWRAAALPFHGRRQGAAPRRRPQPRANEHAPSWWWECCALRGPASLLECQQWSAYPPGSRDTRSRCARPHTAVCFPPVMRRLARTPLPGRLGAQGL